MCHIKRNWNKGFARKQILKLNCVLCTIIKKQWFTKGEVSVKTLKNKPAHTQSTTIERKIIIIQMQRLSPPQQEEAWRWGMRLNSQTWCRQKRGRYRANIFPLFSIVPCPNDLVCLLLFIPPAFFSSHALLYLPLHLSFLVQVICVLLCSFTLRLSACSYFVPERNIKAERERLGILEKCLYSINYI